MNTQAPNRETIGATIPADPASYSTMYLRFLTAKRAFPKLNHAGTEPQPKDFGLSDRDAAFIRVQVDREHQRKK